MYSLDYEDYLNGEFNRLNPGLADLERDERRSRDAIEFDCEWNTNRYHPNQEREIHRHAEIYGDINFGLFVLHQTKGLKRFPYAHELEQLHNLYKAKEPDNRPFHERHDLYLVANIYSGLCEYSQIPF